MILNKEKGGYCQGAVVRLVGSFQINGTSTPDHIRDGKSNCVASVARVSAGLFTVTFDTGFPIPEKLVFSSANLQQQANPTVWSRAHIIGDSYSQSARTFQIQVLKANATADTADAASDADDNDWVCFELVGSINSSGTDTRL